MALRKGIDTKAMPSNLLTNISKQAMELANSCRVSRAERKVLFQNVALFYRNGLRTGNRHDPDRGRVMGFLGGRRRKSDIISRYASWG
jgi:hypothetical protein